MDIFFSFFFPFFFLFFVLPWDNPVLYFLIYKSVTLFDSSDLSSLYNNVFYYSPIRLCCCWIRVCVCMSWFRVDLFIWRGKYRVWHVDLYIASAVTSQSPVNHGIFPAPIEWGHPHRRYACTAFTRWEPDVLTSRQWGMDVHSAHRWWVLKRCRCCPEFVCLRSAIVFCFFPSSLTKLTVAGWREPWILLLLNCGNSSGPATVKIADTSTAPSSKSCARLSTSRTETPMWFLPISIVTAISVSIWKISRWASANSWQLRPSRRRRRCRRRSNRNGRSVCSGNRPRREHGKCSPIDWVRITSADAWTTG